MLPPAAPMISHVAINTALDLVIPILAPVVDTAEEARQFALDSLRDYRPHTREELFLAVEIIAFRHRAVVAVRDSLHPRTSEPMRVKHMQAANALRRNEAAAQRRLDVLQRPRQILAKKAAQLTVEALPPPDAAVVSQQPPPASHAETSPAATPAAATPPPPAATQGAAPPPAATRPAMQPRPTAAPASPPVEIPLTPADEAKLSDQALAEHWANYSPGARALAAALRVQPAPPAGPSA